MRALRPTLDRPLHHDGDPYDDRPLPDLTPRKRQRRQREALAAAV
jgi:hypothetical protein